MKLKKITIDGYRSIKEKMELHCDSFVTVILGANDHGKTNFLDALEHLNEEKTFSRENDLNWDKYEDYENYPDIIYDFLLDKTEKQNIISEYLRVRKIDQILINYKYAQGVVREIEKSIGDISSSKLATTKRIQDLRNKIPELSESIKNTPDDEEAKRKKIAIEEQIAATEATTTAITTQLETAESSLEESKQTLLESAAAYFLHFDEESDNSESDSISAIQFGCEHAIREYENAKNENSTAEGNVQKAQQALTEAQEAGDAGRIAQSGKALEVAKNEAKTLAANLQAPERQANLAKLVLEGIKGGTLSIPNAALSPKIDSPKLPDIISVRRLGVEQERYVYTSIDNMAEEEMTLLDRIFLERIPRVEKFKPVDKFYDRVGRNEISDENQEFMRGIFYYAGLKDADWGELFTQNPFTSKTLSDSSGTLNLTLKNNWSQGKELEFLLRHNSSEDTIDLLISDPSVTGTYVQPTRRSAGFTHFFTLKTILFARQTENPAYSYIWIFDEPGIHLHPHAQNDLMQVFETIGRNNQVIYSTHSIFMANKNYPTRHRLLIKDKNGSRIDGKPYRGHWRAALQMLGTGLPGSVLFANKILLVEGDSDPIYINAIMQKLIELQKLNFDMNNLGIVPTGDVRDAAALIRLFKQSPDEPTLVALLDGDDGGGERIEKLKKLMKKYDISYKQLPKGTTIEDNIIGVKNIYLGSLCEYLRDLPETDGDAVFEALRAKCDAYVAELGEKETEGVASWSRMTAKEVAKLPEEPSPSGIARAYAMRLAETDTNEVGKATELKRSKQLCEWIATSLDLPKLILDEGLILEEIG